MFDQRPPALVAACAVVALSGTASSLAHRVAPRADGPREVIEILLNQEISFAISEAPARPAFEALSSALGIEVIGRWSPDGFGEGLDPDLPLSLDARPRTALSTVELLLSQCESWGEEVTWQLRGDALEIGPKARLGQSLERRIYPIGELMFEMPNFDNAPTLDLDEALSGGGGNSGSGSLGGGGNQGGGFGNGNSGSGGAGQDNPFSPAGPTPDRQKVLDRAEELMDLIMATIEPDQWDLSGGTCTIRFWRGNLVVNAPDFIHRQINGY